MPIYEFTCQNCEEEFELLVASSRSKGACPHCGSGKLKKKLSVFASRMATSSASSSLPCGGNPSQCAGPCGHRHSH